MVNCARDNKMPRSRKAVKHHKKTVVHQKQKKITRNVKDVVVGK